MTLADAISNIFGFLGVFRGAKGGISLPACRPDVV